jgi:xanthine/CO dehydrogenase XdhC/CoxF family maturation factor
MKGRILDRVVAAAREHRSVALATELAGGGQLLLDGDHAEGDLVLDDATLDRMREARRTGRNCTVDTAGGRVFIEVLTPPHRCFVIGAVHIAQPLSQMLTLADYAVTVIDPRGAFVGSVSGGCVEGAVIEEAQAAIRDGKPRLLDFGVSDEQAWEVGLACGGSIEIFVERVE